MSLRSVAALVLFGLPLIAGCRGHEQTPTPAPAQVSPQNAAIGAVSRMPLPRVYEAVGTVRAKTASALESKVVGQVTAVHVSEGDTVTAGQLLVELDNRELAAAVQAGESAVAQAESGLKEAETGVSAAGAAQAAAQASRELAEATNTRMKNLSESQAVSRQAADETSAKQQASAAELRRADESRKSMVAKKGEAEARVAQARAQLDANKTQLSHTRILAPFDGVIVAKRVQPGNLAAPGQPLLDIEDAKQYRLEVSVDESVFAAASKTTLRPGESVPTSLDALQGQLITGTVDEIVPSADPLSRSFLVKVALPGDEHIRSGMFGRVRFTYQEDSVLAVPASAVSERGQLTGVFVANDAGQVQWRLVTLGKRLGDQVEVLSGVNEGERIVVKASGTLQDGQTVATQ